MHHQSLLQNLLNTNAALTLTIVAKDIITYLSNDNVRNMNDHELIAATSNVDLVAIEIWKDNKLETIQFTPCY